MSFSRRTAIVTGGASGIGKALSEALASRGAHVVIADLDEAKAEDVAERLRQRGESATASRVDVVDAEAVDALVERVASERGQLDYMFNNAGIAIAGDVAKLPQAQWDKLIDINIRGVVHGSRSAYRVMQAQRSGHIVNTASLAGLIPSPLFTAYAMTKHAVVGLSTSLRVEAQEHGVRVSAICPGVIQTPMVEGTELLGYDAEAIRTELPSPPYPVERCAADVLAGVERNDALIVVTASARIAHALQRTAPALMRHASSWLLQRRLAKHRR